MSMTTPMTMSMPMSTLTTTSYPSASIYPTTTSSSVNNTATDDGDSDMPEGNLPFVFLLTFVGVFLFFLACGLGSRRLSTEIRRNLGLSTGGQNLSQTPVIWDVVPSMKTAQEEKYRWSDLVPLSATYVREPTKPPLLAGTTTGEATLNVRPNNRLVDYLPSVSLYLAYRDIRRARALEPATSPDSQCVRPRSPPIRALQVSALVAMPSSHRSCASSVRRSIHSESTSSVKGTILPQLTYNSGAPLARYSTDQQKDGGKESIMQIEHPTPATSLDSDPILGEYAIGVAQVPWHVEDDWHAEDDGHAEVYRRDMP
ncbi:uncharacterized protein LAESUDRAFT_732227 [Laetiporus sulphureus 93-53]|uniref:Transmembrane protein n=1 Tax=Laetiporus sulphureus 93-53 TaxID=1314785 RepID=A0A165B8K9_9APHY|nr:uncharacterized protein LAESUDRAFT_732227 [Laetiporus sulphureus 93-53]KZT00494.1 hypothetical protein LAESUDRAFT_732227 [Laetiporus sulphureus 93-53]